jgi:HupF/HypC family protein
MCLAIPGKIIELHEKSCMRMGRIDYGGITREACPEPIADPRCEFGPEGTAKWQNAALKNGRNRWLPLVPLK